MMMSASEVTIACSLSSASIVMICSSLDQTTVERREILVELLLIVANRDLGAAVIDDVRHLINGVGHVDRCGDACCGADAHLGDHPVAAVVTDERNAIAGLHTERDQTLSRGHVRPASTRPNWSKPSHHPGPSRRAPCDQAARRASRAICPGKVHVSFMTASTVSSDLTPICSVCPQKPAPCTVTSVRNSRGFCFGPTAAFWP